MKNIIKIQKYIIKYDKNDKKYFILGSGNKEREASEGNR